jgi:hypothetical protein
MTFSEADVRKQVPFYLSPSVADCAGISVSQMAQYAAGTYALSEGQRLALALAMNMRPGFKLCAGPRR